MQHNRIIITENSCRSLLQNK